MNASTETAAPPLMSITVLIATSPALMVASSVASETLRERSWTLSASCRLMSSIGVSSQSKRPPPRLRDPHARDLELVAAGDHALSRAVASPARTSSTICSIENPCASMMALVQPSRQDASNSSPRRRVVGSSTAPGGRRGLNGPSNRRGGTNRARRRRRERQVCHWPKYPLPFNGAAEVGLPP
jgi:hypothetical protein